MRSILIALTLIATALTFYSALWFKSVTIENDITDRVTDDLAATDAKDIAIDVDGRHVTLSGIVYDAAAETAYLDTADATYGALGPIDGLTYQADGGYVTAIKTDAGITLRGTVPNDAARDALIAEATAATSGDVDDQLVISGPVAAWQDEASFGIGQLAALTTGTVTAAAGTYALSGMADGDADSVTSTVNARDGWQALISAPTPTDDLTQEIARLNGTVADRDAEIAQATTERAGLTAALGTVRANLMAGQTDAATLRSDLGAATGNIADRDATIAQLTTDRDGLSAELDDLRANLTEDQSNAADLRAALATANDGIADRDTTIADLNEGIAAANRRTTGGEALIAALSNTIEGNKTDAAAMTAQVADLTGQTDVMTGRITELETELANRQNALGSTDAEVARLQGEVTDLTDVVAARDADIADLTGVVSARNAAIASLSGAVATGNSERADLTDVVATRDATIADLQGQLGEVGDLSSVVAERDATIADLRQSNTDADTMVATLKSDLATREGTIATMSATVDDTAAQVTVLGTTVDAQGQEITNLQGIVSDLNTTVAARDATIASLRNAPSTASTADQCAAQASAVMEGSQINFGIANANIDAASTDLLERLTGIALACVGENLTVEVGGHTDNEGSDAANQTLSEARAQAVLAFMADRGVPTGGLKAVGYGESQPVADNATSEGRAENRRISFDWQAR